MTVLLPTAFAVLLFHRSDKKRHTVSRRHTVLLLLFSVYLFGVFHCTGSGTLYDVLRLGPGIRTDEIHLIPFFGTGIDYMGYALNIVLFVPLGLLLPLIGAGYKKYRCVLLTGFSLSLLVEISQLLNFRRTDVDDLILNSAGAVLGLLLYKGIAPMIKRADAPAAPADHQAIILILTAFLCRFLAFNEFGLAEKLFTVSF